MKLSLRERQLSVSYWLVLFTQTLYLTISHSLVFKGDTLWVETREAQKYAPVRKDVFTQWSSFGFKNDLKKTNKKNLE